VEFGWFHFRSVGVRVWYMQLSIASLEGKHCLVWVRLALFQLSQFCSLGKVQFGG
jgi:hypothetical protein